MFDANVGDGADSGDAGDKGDEGVNDRRAQENGEKESDSGGMDGSWSWFVSLVVCENEDGVQGKGLERIEGGCDGGGGGECL